MNPAHMDRILDLLKQEEVQDALWCVDVCERNANLDQQEADEWRRRDWALTYGTLRTNTSSMDIVSSRRFVARIVPTDA
jgi:hypothetical protein